MTFRKSQLCAVVLRPPGGRYAHATSQTRTSRAPATRQTRPFRRCSIVEPIRRQENRALLISSASDEFRRRMISDWEWFSTPP